MSDSSYDLEHVIEAISGGPTWGSDVQKLSVGPASTLLLAFNSQRVMCVLTNSASPLFVKLGINAALDDYSFSIDAGQTASIDRYGGPVSAIRQSATDTVRVTEVF